MYSSILIFRMSKNFTCLFILSIYLFITDAQAAKLESFCHVLNQPGQQKVLGQDVNEKLPIASVSKLVTSYWSIVVRSKNYRFPTIVHYRKIDSESYDIHLEGSRDPYFGKDFLHYIISELNQMGITKVRNLTFDENFKFFWQVTSPGIAIGDYTPDSPSPEVVTNQLIKRKSLLDGYDKTVMDSKSSGINFIKSPKFSVDKTLYLEKSKFNKKDFNSVTFKSSPLDEILKEMNRNSNNHAANQIFESLGGADEFQKFIKKRLNYDLEDIEFVNGSGDSLIVNGQKKYNEAKCQIILKILVDFENVLKSQGLDFTDVVSVIGRDLGSTSNKLYNNSVTKNTVVAKTGTVSPSILLAGEMSTKKGNVFFMYNMKTNGTKRDWRNAQKQIKIKITQLIQTTYNGGVPIEYTSSRFFPFDEDSLDNYDLDSDEVVTLDKTSRSDIKAN